MTTPLRAILFSLIAAPVPALHAIDSMPASSTDIVGDQVVSNTLGSETTTVLTGHVVVTGNNIRINCDYLKAISTSASEGSAAGTGQHYKFILATGHVQIFDGAIEAICGRAELVPDSERITLWEKPIIKDHKKGTVFTGEPVILTGHGKDYAVSGTGVHITGLAPIQELAPSQAPAPKP